MNFNNELIDIKQYRQKLLYHFFKIENEPPSFRNLIGKFIRIKSNEMENLLKYLHPTASNMDYRIIRRALFGYTELTSTNLRTKAEKELNELKKQNKDIAKSNLNELEQELALLQKDVKELDEKRTRLNLAENIEKLLLEQADDNYAYSELKTKIDTIKFEIERAKNSLILLESDKTKIDNTVLQSMYSEAKNLVGNALKQFEQLVLFHNKSIENEKKFIEVRLSTLFEEEKKIKNELAKLSEKQLSIQVACELNSIAQELSQTNQKIGRCQEQKDRFINYTKKCNDLTKMISQYKNDDKEINSFNEKIKTFNAIFSDYFKIIFKENPPVIYSDDSEGVALQSELERQGAGGKSSAVVVFDLAYFSFAQKEKLNVPRFQIHDRLELTDFDAKKKAFIEILPQVDCQFIVPALRSSLVEFGEEFIMQNKILELSKTEKLFRLENQITG